MSVNPVSMAAMAAAAEAVTATEEIAEEVPAATETRAPAGSPVSESDTISGVCFPFRGGTRFFHAIIPSSSNVLAFYPATFPATSSPNFITASSSAVTPNHEAPL